MLVDAVSSGSVPLGDDEVGVLDQSGDRVPGFRVRILALPPTGQELLLENPWLWQAADDDTLTTH